MGKGISSHYNVVAKPRASTSRVSFHGNQYPLTGEYWRPGEWYGEGWRPMFLLLIRILVEGGWRMFPYIWINILLWVVVGRKGRICSYMPIYNIYILYMGINIFGGEMGGVCGRIWESISCGGGWVGAGRGVSNFNYPRSTCRCRLHSKFADLQSCMIFSQYLQNLSIIVV